MATESKVELSFAVILVGYLNDDEQKVVEKALENNTPVEILEAFARNRLAREEIRSETPESAQVARDWVNACLAAGNFSATPLLFTMTTQTAADVRIPAVVVAIDNGNVVEFANVVIEDVPTVKDKKVARLTFHTPNIVGYQKNVNALNAPHMQHYTVELLRQLLAGVYKLMVLVGDAMDLVVICQEGVNELAAKHFSFKPLAPYLEKAPEVFDFKLPKEFHGRFLGESKTTCYGWDRRWPITKVARGGIKTTKAAWHFLSTTGQWIGDVIHEWKERHPKPKDISGFRKHMTISLSTIEGAGAGTVTGMGVYYLVNANLGYGLATVVGGSAAILATPILTYAMYNFVHYQLCLLGDFVSWVVAQVKRLMSLVVAQVKRPIVYAGKMIERATAPARSAMTHRMYRARTTIQTFGRALSRSLSPLCPRRHGLAGPPPGYGGAAAPSVPASYVDPENSGSHAPEGGAGAGSARVDVDRGRGPDNNKRRQEGYPGRSGKRVRTAGPDEDKSWTLSRCSMPLDIKISKATFPTIKTADEVIPKHSLPPPKSRCSRGECGEVQGKVRLTLKVPKRKNGLKVLYWAAKKPKNGQVKDQKASYGNYSNLGVGQVKDNKIVFCLDEPRVYSVHGKIYAPHLHFVFANREETQWQNKVYSVYVPRRACGVKGLTTYDAKRLHTYTPATPLLIKGSRARQRRIAKQLANKSLYNVFFSI